MLNGASLEVKPKGLSDEDFLQFIKIIKTFPGRKYVEGTWIVSVTLHAELYKTFGSQLVWTPEYKEIAKAHPSYGLSTVLDNLDLDGIKLQLYPFQLVGAAFLISLGQGMLADEMGLGKTVQAITATHELYRRGKIKRALVICPASLKYQWEDEIQKFTDYGVRVIDGDVDDRTKLYAEEPQLFTVINYELARQEFDLERLKKLEPDVIILDEAHRIKNWEAKVSISLKQLDAPYKWLLTGTPMQNKPEELYSLFSFLNPEILGNWWAFRSRYIILGTKFGRRNVPVGTKNLPELRQRIAPYMLRRLKAEVAPELPELVVNNYHVIMTEEQEKLHEAVREDIHNLIDEMKRYRGEEPHPKEGQLLGMFTMLMEICDSPQLLNMSDSRMAKRYKATGKKSPKLDELVSIVSSNLDEDPNFKAVIFTQFERMQRLIVERLSKVGKCVVLNGSMKPYERQAAIDKFKFDPSVNFFVSTDAGNYGINLEIAPMVVNVDLPWNPAVWAQRGGRIHRIGSKHETVYVVNLIAKNGIDERILSVLYGKMELSDQLIEKTESEKIAISRLTSGVLDRLVRKSRRKKGSQ